MQNKGAITLLAIALALVSLYQLSLPGKPIGWKKLRGNMRREIP